MNQPKIPGGLDKQGKTLEIYIIEGQLRADYRGERISFWDLPETLINIFRKEMNNMPYRVSQLNIDNIKDENERLEKYVGYCYGIFDNYADYEEGVGTKDELSGDQFSKVNKLTYRERQIMTLISNGFTDKDIAARLFISPYTVANHRNNILAKTGCKNSMELTKLAIEKNITVN